MRAVRAHPASLFRYLTAVDPGADQFPSTRSRHRHLSSPVVVVVVVVGKIKIRPRREKSSVPPTRSTSVIITSPLFLQNIFTEDVLSGPRRLPK